MARTLSALTFAILIASCVRHDSSSVADHARDARITAADVFTRRWQSAPLAKWKMRGRAAGADCRVLVVDTPMLLDDTTVEAMHYGTGHYTSDEGGIRRFSSDHAFRGVVYRDQTRHFWFFGDVRRDESESLQPCR